MRTRRTNGSTAYSYVYNGGSLSRMTVGSTTLDFRYDASGTPMTVTYGGTAYYYATNLQGDVVAILDGSGTAVVSYTYDAWGNVLSTTGSLASTLGTHNPLRYRGYVYDTETELYYVSSRYYDPSLNRFINADVLISTGQGLLGNNMFAYCRNNPVSRRDISGMADVDTNMTDDPIKDLMDQNEQGGGAGGNKSGNISYASGGINSSDTITVYRAVSPSEYNSETSSQEFLAVPNGYESGKYFATTYADAVQWGNKMYSDGNYNVLEATFDAQILNMPDTFSWNKLDGIGPAYFFGMGAANSFVIQLR